MPGNGDPCDVVCLQLFEDMRNGKFEANAATLRLKMDMSSPNPNMWDQVRASSSPSALAIHALSHGETLTSRQLTSSRKEARDSEPFYLVAY